MAARSSQKEGAELEVVPDSVDGWDVVERGESQSLSNHATRAEAEEAARRRGDLEQAEAVEVDVREDEVHGIDEESRGMRIAFFSLGGLLITVLALIVVIALIASLTSFGS